jgi:hypothetical protein
MGANPRPDDGHRLDVWNDLADSSVVGPHTHTVDVVIPLNVLEVQGWMVLVRLQQGVLLLCQLLDVGWKMVEKLLEGA